MKINLAQIERILVVRVIVTAAALDNLARYRYVSSADSCPLRVAKVRC